MKKLKCGSAWSFYDNFVHTCDTGDGVDGVDGRDFDTASYFLANALMVNSTQQSGAVINLTTEEYGRARKGESSMYVIRVVEHKTGTSDTAKLVMTAKLREKMDSYLQKILPYLISTHVDEEDKDKFFLQYCVDRLTFMAACVGIIDKQFGFPMATSTEVRKAAATKTARIPEEKRVIVAKQLSHSLSI